MNKQKLISIIKIMITVRPRRYGPYDSPYKLHKDFVLTFDSKTKELCIVEQKSNRTSYYWHALQCFLGKIFYNRSSRKFETR